MAQEDGSFKFDPVKAIEEAGRQSAGPVTVVLVTNIEDVMKGLLERGANHAVKNEPHNGGTCGGFRNQLTTGGLVVNIITAEAIQ